MASSCGGSDFNITQGDTTPINFQFLNADGSFFDITSYNFRLIITYANGQQTYTTPGSAELSINTGTSTLTWTPTSAESALLPLGPSSTYGVAALLGMTIDTWVTGTITGLSNG